MRVFCKSGSIILVLIVVMLMLFTACAQTAPATSTPSTTAPAPGPTTSTLLPGTGQTASPAPTAPAAKSTAPATKSAAPAAQKPVYGGILKYVSGSSPSQPIGTPWEANLATPSYQFGLEKLLAQKGTGEIESELCTSWEYDTSKASPSITLHLRKGVKFQDGTDFNAQAVKWNLDMFKNGGRFPSTKYNKSYDIIDNYTIKIPLTEWRNTFVPIFAGIQGYMVSPTAYEKNGLEWMRWNQVGTGPFKQVSFQRDVAWKFVRSDNYWDEGKPYLMGIEDTAVSDETTRVALWKTGAVDVMAVSARYASEFRDLGYTVTAFPNGVLPLMPDGLNPNSPWSNKKVREAAEYAIDKEGLAKAYGYGIQKAAYQLPSSNSKAYNPDIPGRKYDPAKAKQLLAEAGYPGGFKTKIIAGTTSDLIVALKSMLDAVGIQVDLDIVGGAKMSTYMSGTWDNALCMGSIVEIANYNTTFNNFLSSPPSLWKSVKLPDNWDTLYNDTVTSPEVDPKLQQKAVRAIYDEISVIPVLYNMSMYAVNAKLQDSNIGTKVLYWESKNAWFSK